MNNLKPETLRRLLNFEATHDLNAELERFLDNGGLVEMIKPPPKVFPTWMTVTRGLHPTPQAYLKALEAKGYKIGKSARKIVEAMIVSPKKVDVELVRVSCGDLGRLGLVTDREFFDLAATFGLAPCLAEDVVLVRLALRPGLIGFVTMAMEAIEVSDRFQQRLTVDGQELDSETYNPNYRGLSDVARIFMRIPKVA